MDSNEPDVWFWPFSTHAAIYADVGFRATAEVLENHRDKWLTVTAGRPFNTLFRKPERQPLAEPPRISRRVGGKVAIDRARASRRFYPFTVIGIIGRTKFTQSASVT